MGENPTPDQIRAFNDEMLAEADNFLRERGIVSIGERRASLVKALDGEQKGRMDKLQKEVFNNLEEEIVRLPPVGRLNELLQLNGKFDPSAFPEGTDFQMVRPAFHTRFQHSELLAELAKVAAIKLGLSEKEIITMACAGWLHDIGHSAFSHSGEIVVLETEKDDHEKRTIDLLKKPEIQDFLRKFKVDIQDVIDIVNEEGPLGTLQSVFDTLSYIVVDSEMFEKKLYPDSGAKLIGVLGSISPDGQIVLQDVEPWQQLIETRAKMMKEYYYHPVSARSSGALEQLLRLAIKGGYLTVDELKNSGDDRIRLRIQSLVREDRGAALLSGRQELAPYLSDYVDLFDVSLGFYDQRKWQQLKFSSKSELDNFLMTLEKEVSEKAIKVSPYDFTKKKITVTRKQQDGNLEEVKLKSKNTELDEDNTKFTLYIPQ